VPDIAGWTFRDVITMQSVVALAFGLNVSVFGNLHRIPQLIARGQLDYYLLLPKDPLLHMLVSRSDMSGFGDMAFGIAAFMMFTPVSWQRIILFLATGLAAATVYASFVTVAGSLAFLMGNAQTVGAQLAQAMVTFSGYPGSCSKARSGRCSIRQYRLAFLHMSQSNCCAISAGCFLRAYGICRLQRNSREGPVSRRPSPVRVRQSDDGQSVTVPSQCAHQQSTTSGHWARGERPSPDLRPGPGLQIFRRGCYRPPCA